MMPARGRRRQRIGLAVAALAVALGTAEQCARALAPEWLRARMREVAVGRSLGSWGSDADWPVERNGSRIVRFVPRSEFTIRDDEYFHRVQIDEYGGRASGRAASAAMPIVPVFGDSMTFGLGVPDDETWVSLAGRALPVRLVNFGIPGTDLLNQLDSLELLSGRVPSSRLCLFVVFLGNDLSTIAATMDPDVSDAAAPSASLSDWLFAANRTLDEHWMLRRWYAVQWARAMTVRAVNASRSHPQVQAMFALMDRTARLDRERRGFERAVDRLVMTAARFRFTPAVVVLPDHFQVEARVRLDKAALYGVPASSFDPRQPNRIVTEALAARGVAFVDASPCLEGRREQYYVRDGHFTAAGHRTIADCLGPFLAERSAAALP